MDAGEREALIAFNKATGGDSWIKKEGWCTDALLIKWYGVFTNDQWSIVKLNLTSNNLKGEAIPVRSS